MAAPSTSHTIATALAVGVREVMLRYFAAYSRPCASSRVAIAARNQINTPPPHFEV
ncbi:hypothetical protein AKJ09_02155 [Labilithrix luteola]|uniref:Uncharacterized protein n=1 Tax=Labilithrix luteola TaxID=1391654 RepID=A0A0K1PQ28_9BACT|nr:hypothetical protein AKJ09_02155 [Labilithrix luteola]